MADDTIRARVSAVRRIADGLGTYARALDGAGVSARSDLNAAAAKFQTIVAQSQRDLESARQQRARAEAELARCREGCGGLQQHVSRCRAAEVLAERRHERNRQALTRFERASGELLAVLAVVERQAQQLVPAARQNVREHAEGLDAYLKAQVGG